MTVFTENSTVDDFRLFIDGHPVLCDDARLWLLEHKDLTLGAAFQMVIDDTTIPTDWCTFVIGYYRSNINSVIRDMCVIKIRQEPEIVVNMVRAPIPDEDKILLVTGVNTDG